MDSRAELFHCATLRADRSLCTGPCEASRELSQMFLSERDEREKVRPMRGPRLDKFEKLIKLKTYP